MVLAITQQTFWEAGKEVSKKVKYYRIFAVTLGKILENFVSSKFH